MATRDRQATTDHEAGRADGGRGASPEEPQAIGAARRGAVRKRRRLAERNPNWPAQAAVGVAIVLGLALPKELTIGAPWIMPACEAVLLAGLILWTPRSPTDEAPRARLARFVLVGTVSAVNVVSLFLLTQLLLQGGRPADARSLLAGGAVLWITAVLLFAVWFWELDRGGPVRRLLDHDMTPDFLFPQMSDDWASPKGWKPGMGDYLYLSLNNAASFSPAETVPLTGQAKLVMSIQTFASLTTMTIVLAYAINNLS